MPAARVLILQLDPSDPPARLGEWLTAEGLELDVRALDAGEPVPDELSGHAGLVVLGGAMGAWDDQRAPYLPAVRALLREAVTAEIPTLGVCLGHQLLAAAHGGRVQPMPDGPEIGAQLVAKRSVAGGDPLFGMLPITPDVLQWHYDEVSVLPPGAIQLYSSPGCEHQAFRLGRLAWGIQFHLETTPEIVRAWLAADAAELEHLDVDRVMQRVLDVDEDIVEVWAPMVAAFAAVVRDPGTVQPARTVPTSTAQPVTDPAAIRAALAAELAASRQQPGPTMLPMPGRRMEDD